MDEAAIQKALKAWDESTGKAIPERASYSDIVPDGWHMFAPELFATARETGCDRPRATARRLFEAGLRKRG